MPTTQAVRSALVMFSLSLTVNLAACLLGASPAEATEPVALFDGATLSGWDGDQRFWRVEDRAIVGETTEENAAEQNTFLVYRGGQFSDFVLRLKYKVKGFNSGVQYRSVERGEWSIAGYQCDFESQWHEDGTLDRFTGMLYDEAGRGFLAMRGESVVVGPPAEGSEEPSKAVVGSLGDAASLEQTINRDGWNEIAIYAVGNQLTHVVNGRVFATAYDNDPKHRRASGLIALQLHSGPPMRIDVKDITVVDLQE